MPIAFDRFIEAECGNPIDFAKSRSSMTRTPRIVRIIPSICSTAMGDFVFFATGEKDYLNIPPMRGRVCDFFASTYANASA